MVMIGGALDPFKAKYHRIVESSPADAEYMALILCTQEMLWIRTMQKDLGHGQVGATLIWKDNQGAVGLASNAGYNSRIEQVDIVIILCRRT